MGSLMILAGVAILILKIVSRNTSTASLPNGRTATRPK
jgi:hypothetical protein